MKKINYLLLTLIFISATAMKTGMPAYNLFDKKGKEAKYKHLLKDAAQADVVLFGELHNNPIGHWLQLELTGSLYDEKDGNIVLGAEMFEADNQLLLDEYTTGLIRERNFENEAKLWNNYQTDYKPLVEFARAHNLKFVATNIPRRYASMVHQQGFEALDSLPATAQAYIAPLPVLYDAELPGYKGMLAMMGDMRHANDNLPKAQAIKDATMANFILENLQPGQTLIH
ncbi:MAG: ChaN family lipoprotein, partial [Bacteroidales bacterium]